MSAKSQYNLLVQNELYFRKLYGDKKYKKTLSYYKPKAEVEDRNETLKKYDIDIDTPNYKQLQALVDREDFFKNLYGNEKYESTYNYYYNASQYEQNVLDKAIKYKSKKNTYSTDIANYAPELQGLFSYDDSEEDMYRQALGLAPKSFDAQAKTIISAGRAADKKRKEASQKAEKERQKNEIINQMKTMNPDSAEYKNAQAKIDELDNEEEATTLADLLSDDATVSEEDFKRYLEMFSPALQKQIQDQNIQSTRNAGHQLYNYMQDKWADEEAAKIGAQKLMAPTYTAANNIIKQDAKDAKNYPKVFAQVENREKRREEYLTGAMAIAEDIGKTMNRTPDQVISQYQQEKGRVKQGYIKELPAEYKTLDDYYKQYENQTDILIPSRQEVQEAMSNPVAAGATGFLIGGVDMGLGQAGAKLFGLDKGIYITPEQYDDLVKNPPNQASKSATKNQGRNTRYGLYEAPSIVIPEMKNGKLVYYVPSTMEEAQQLQANNPLAYGIGNMVGSIPAMVATGGASAEAATAMGIGKLGSRMIAGAVPGAIRSGSQSIAQGQGVGNVLLNTAGGAVIGAAGQAASAGLEGLTAGALQKAPEIVRNIAGNAVGSIGYSGIDIAGRAGLGALTGQKIDWTQELADLPANIALDVVLGGKIDLPNGKLSDIPEATAKQIIDASISDGQLDVDKVSSALESWFGRFGASGSSIVEEGLNRMQNFGRFDEAAKVGEALNAWNTNLFGNKKATPTKTELQKVTDAYAKVVKGQVKEENTNVNDIITADKLNEQVLTKKVGNSKLKDTISKTLNIKKPLDAQFKQSLDNMTANYDKVGNKQQKAVAKNFVDKNFEQAEKYIKESNRLQSSADAAIASELIDRYRSTGRDDEALEMIRQTARKFSIAGQDLQSSVIWAKMTPEGIVKGVDAAITKANKKLSDNKKFIMSDEDAKYLMDTSEKLSTMDAQELRNLFINVAEQRNRKLGKATYDELDYMVKQNDVDMLKNATYNNLMLSVLDKVPRTLGQKISTIQAFSHLINPRTAIRNVLSNAVFKQQENLTDYTASLVDYLMSLKTKQRTVKTPSPKGFKQDMEARKMYAQRSAFEIQSGVNLDADMGKYDLFTKEAFPASQNKVLNKIERLLSYELKTADQVSKGATEISEIRKQLVLQGKDVNGKSIDELIGMADDETLKIAKQQALYSSFQDDGMIAGVLGGLKKALNKIGINDGDFGLGDLVLKYTKVPGNIIQRSIDYTPAGVLKLFKYIGTKGLTREQQRDIAKTIGRSVTGSSISAASYLLTKLGIMVSASSQNDREKDFEQDAGLKGRRINVSAIGRILEGKSPDLQEGDTLLSVDFLETLNVPMALGYELAKADDEKIPADKAIANLGNAFGEEILDLPMMYVINSMFYEGMKKDSNVGTVIAVPFIQALPGFVPAPIRQASTSLDKFQREAKTTVERLLSNTPARGTLNIKQGTFGQNLTQDAGILAFFNPGNTTTYEPAIKFAKQLKQLADKNKDYEIYPTGENVKYFTKDKKTYTLTEQEQREFMELYGGMLRSAYDQILASGESDTEKIKLLKSAQSNIKQAIKDNYIYNKGG